MITHRHRDITDPVLRRMFAEELWALRRVTRRMSVSMQSEWIRGIILGFETALRRVQAWQEKGLQNV